MVHLARLRKQGIITAAEMANLMRYIDGKLAAGVPDAYIARRVSHAEQRELVLEICQFDSPDSKARDGMTFQTFSPSQKTRDDEESSEDGF